MFVASVHNTTHCGNRLFLRGAWLGNKVCKQEDGKQVNSSCYQAAYNDAISTKFGQADLSIKHTQIN